MAETDKIRLGHLTLEDRPCVRCGKAYRPTKPWQKYCSKVCQTRRRRSEQVSKWHDQRRHLLDQLKLKIGCVECGYSEHPAALDWSHRDDRGQKSFNIGANIKRSWDDTLTEIAKCDVLCANCHRVMTFESKHWHEKRRDKGGSIRR